MEASRLRMRGAQSDSETGHEIGIGVAVARCIVLGRRRKFNKTNRFPLLWRYMYSGNANHPIALFGGCTPQHPIYACMVSGEGARSIYYQGLQERSSMAANKI